MSNSTARLILLTLTLFLGLSHGSLGTLPLSRGIGCFTAGECLNGTSVGVSDQDTPDLCLASCKDTDSCLFFTHYEESSLCVLQSSCPAFSDSNCADCVSGEVTCNESGKLINVLDGFSPKCICKGKYNKIKKDKHFWQTLPIRVLYAV